MLGRYIHTYFSYVCRYLHAKKLFPKRRRNFFERAVFTESLSELQSKSQSFNPLSLNKLVKSYFLLSALRNNEEHGSFSSFTDVGSTVFFTSI
jgi:hypothetical protein